MRGAVRQLGMQGSVYTGEHPPLLKVSDESLDSQVSDDGCYPPATPQAVTQDGQV